MRSKIRRNKRLFISVLSCLVFFLLSGICYVLLPFYNADQNITHGNLIFTQDKISQIKNLPADSTQKKAFLAYADYYVNLQTAPVKPICDSDKDYYCYRTLGDYRYYQQVVEDLTMAYLITDSSNPNHDAYKTRALLYVDNILNYPPHWPWDAGQDLQASSFLFALSFVYDYLHDDIELNSQLKDKLSERIETELAYQINVWPIINDNQPSSYLGNHYWVTLAAIYQSAVAFEDILPPKDVAEYKELANNAFINQIIPLLDPDGAPPEGPEYSLYGIKNLFVYFEIRRNIENVDLYKSSTFFNNVGHYIQDTIFPSQKSFVNVGDSPNPEGIWTDPKAIIYHLADEFQDGELQNFANSCAGIKDSDTLYALFWLNPPSIITEASDNLNARYKKTGEVIHKSDNTKDAFYFYSTNGLIQTGHAHPDGGQFTIDYKQNHLLTDDGYSYWKTTQAHNTLMVDGYGQLLENAVWPDLTKLKGANPTETDYFTDQAHDYVHFTADLDSLYRPQAELTKYTRNFSIIGNYVILLDEVKTKTEKLLEINFNNGDNAKVTDTTNRFSLSENGETSTLKVNNSKVVFYLDKGKSNSIEQTFTVPNIIPDKIGWNIIIYPLQDYIKKNNINDLRTREIFSQFPNIYKDNQLAASLLPNPHGYHLSEKTTSSDSLFKNLLFVGSDTDTEPIVKNIDTPEIAGYGITDANQAITYLFNKTADMSKTLTYNDISFQGKMVTQILDLKSGKTDTYTKQAKIIEDVSSSDTRSGEPILNQDETTPSTPSENLSSGSNSTQSTPVVDNINQIKTYNTKNQPKNIFEKTSESIKNDIATVSEEIDIKIPAVKEAKEFVSGAGVTDKNRTVFYILLSCLAVVSIIIVVILIVGGIEIKKSEEISSLTKNMT